MCVPSQSSVLFLYQVSTASPNTCETIMPFLSDNVDPPVGDAIHEVHCI